jgi:hypothetical protein
MTQVNKSNTTSSSASSVKKIDAKEAGISSAGKLYNKV